MLVWDEDTASTDTSAAIKAAPQNATGVHP